MDADSTSIDKRRYLREASVAIAVLGILAPIIGLITFGLVVYFPSIFLGQPKDAVIGWGWVTVPLAALIAPPATVVATYVLLKRLTKYAAQHLVGGCLFYSLAFAIGLDEYLLLPIGWVETLFK